jgi:hypothetical protein
MSLVGAAEGAAAAYFLNGNLLPVDDMMAAAAGAAAAFYVDKQVRSSGGALYTAGSMAVVGSLVVGRVAQLVGSAVLGPELGVWVGRAGVLAPMLLLNSLQYAH